MDKNFINMLLGLNDKRKYKDLNYILSKFREASATDSNLYKDPNKLKRISDSIMDKVDITDAYIMSLIKIEAHSPYSIFKFILDKEYSDILIYHKGINVKGIDLEEKFIIDDELYDIYNLFIDHFIQNVVFLASRKFDTANNVLDADIQGMRFNIIHGTIISYGRPVITIRKNLLKGKNIIPSDYIKSISATDKQINLIHQYAVKGSYIIFGEVGSGKSTLLNYMGNYKLEEKDNLCVIEDTQELNIDVPLTELTNNHANIKKLFINALRQNPSHIIIGETRTDEIVDILQSALTINVGTTIHAGSFFKVIQRIVFMSLDRQLPPDHVLMLINAAIDCFIFMEDKKIKEMWIHKKGYYKDVYEAYEKVE